MREPSAPKRSQTPTRSPEKEAYGWYASATLHIGKVRIPKQLWTLLMCIVALLAVVYLLVTKFMPGSTGDAKPASASPAQSSSGQVAANPGAERKPMTTAEYAASYQPRLPGLMHTAPAYDKLTEPKRVPVLAACVYAPKAVREGAADGCKCYTQDATPYPVDLGMCKQLVAQGAVPGLPARRGAQRAGRGPKTLCRPGNTPSRAVARAHRYRRRGKGTWCACGCVRFRA